MIQISFQEIANIMYNRLHLLFVLFLVPPSSIIQKMSNCLIH